MSQTTGITAARVMAGVMLGLALALGTVATPAGADGDDRFARAKADYDEAAASGDQKHPGYDRALVVWQEMAADGDPRAMYHIGMMYMFGLGSVGIDQEVAMQHVSAAAEGGYPVAQSFMGWVVETGDGTMAVTGDAAALAWWRKGAEGGHCTAVRRMSRAYRNGELGLEPDADEADAWAAREEGCFKN